MTVGKTAARRHGTSRLFMRETKAITAKRHGHVQPGQHADDAKKEEVLPRGEKRSGVGEGLRCRVTVAVIGPGRRVVSILICKMERDTGSWGQNAEAAKTGGAFTKKKGVAPTQEIEKQPSATACRRGYFSGGGGASCAGN